MAIATDDAVGSAANASQASLIRRLTVAYNALVDEMDALTAKLDADAGITDTDYQAEHGDSNLTKITINGSAPS